MKSKTHLMVFLLTVVLVFVSVQKTEANEMQRLFFRVAANVGRVETTLIIQGLTPQTAGDVNQSINAAIRTLNEIIDFPYQDPPFRVDMIVQCREKLSRFNQVAPQKNNRARAAYFTDIFSDFIACMSLIFDSRQGLRARYTCDTAVAYLGYHLARGFVSALNNDSYRVSSARGGVSQALQGGIQSRKDLGCSFPFWEQWEGMRFQDVRTAEDWLRVLNESDGLVASSLGMASAPFQFPSSSAGGKKGIVGRYKLATTDLSKDPRSWNHPFAGAKVEIKACGNRFCGYLYDLTNAQRQLGYQEGEKIYEFALAPSRDVYLRVGYEGWVMWRMPGGGSARGKLILTFYSGDKWEDNIIVEEHFGNKTGHGAGIKIR